jgi:hypothetical protein
LGVLTSIGKIKNMLTIIESAELQPVNNESLKLLKVFPQMFVIL